MRSAPLVVSLSVLAALVLPSGSPSAGTHNVRVESDPAETPAAPAEDVLAPMTGAASHGVEVAPGIYVRVKGPNERRRVRYALWTQGLSGDRREVYQGEGFPPFRHYENFAGDRTEHWSYPGSHTTYVFRDGSLVRTEIFSIEFAERQSWNGGGAY